MVGNIIDAKAPFPKMAFLCLALGISSLAGGIATGNLHLPMLATLPLTLFLAFWISRQKDVAFRLDEDGIHVLDGRAAIRYDDIVAISRAGNVDSIGHASASRKPLHIHHTQGELILPESPGLHSAELVQFLEARRTPPPPKIPPEALVEYVDGQVDRFGEDKVTLIHSRDSLPREGSRRIAGRIALAIFVTSVIWFVAAMAYAINYPRDDEMVAWVGFGILGIFVALLVWAIALSEKKKHEQKFKAGKSCLVVSPSALGVQQGAMRGVLRWDEILSVSTKASRANVVLQLKIAGGMVEIFDIYEWSLTDIASTIQKNRGHGYAAS